jgi:hypothetical protein
LDEWSASLKVLGPWVNLSFARRPEAGPVYPGPSHPVPGHRGASSGLTCAGLRLRSTFAERLSNSSQMYFGLSRDIVQGAAAQGNAAAAFPCSEPTQEEVITLVSPR